MDAYNGLSEANSEAPQIQPDRHYYTMTLRFKDEKFGPYGVKETLSYLEAVSVLSHNQLKYFPVIKASEYADLQLDINYRSKPLASYQGEEVIRFLIGYDRCLFWDLDIIKERLPDFKLHEKMLSGLSHAFLVLEKTHRRYPISSISQKELMEPRYFRVVRPNGYLVGDFELSVSEPLPALPSQWLGGDLSVELLKADGSVRSRLSVQSYAYIQQFEATGWPYYEQGTGFGSTLIATESYEPFILTHYPDYIQFLKGKGLLESERDEAFKETVRQLWVRGEWSCHLMDFHWDRNASMREDGAFEWLHEIQGKRLRHVVDNINLELLKEERLKDLYPGDFQAVVEQTRAIAIKYPHLIVEGRIPKSILMNRYFWFPLFELNGTGYNVAQFIPTSLLDDEIIQLDLVQNGYLSKIDLHDRLLLSSVDPSPLRDLMRNPRDIERISNQQDATIDTPFVYYAMARDYRLLSLIPEKKLWKVKGCEQRLIYTLKRQVTSQSLTHALDKIPVPLRTEKVLSTIEELKASFCPSTKENRMSDWKEFLRTHR